MSGASEGLRIREVELAAVMDLRNRVLRDHMPGSPATAPSDHLTGTAHLGAFRGDRLVGVITWFAEESSGRPGVRAARFRFMAVEPDERGTGVGRALMEEVIERARAAGNSLLWANGRDTVLDFYTRLGFRVAGDGFVDTTSLLPHHRVELDL